MNINQQKSAEPKVHEKTYKIIVNAREHDFKGDEITFDQVIILAFGSVSTDPNIAYTVTYKRGHGNKPEGSMVKGDVVKVKEGMIFNATATNKS
jgi:hypothetical protein